MTSKELCGRISIGASSISKKEFLELVNGNPCSGFRGTEQNSACPDKNRTEP